MWKFDIWNISLNEIHLFLEAVKYMSFSKAAESMNVSKSVFSKNIGKLENTLGIILFIRKQNGLQLTPAGRYLHEVLTVYCNNVENAVMNARIIQEGKKGRIVVGYPDTFGSKNLFNDSVEKFKKSHPDIDVFFEKYDFFMLANKLKNDEIDIAISVKFNINSFIDDDIFFKYVRVVPLTVCMLPDNPLSVKESISCKDLKSMKFVVLSPNNYASYMSEVIDPIGEEGNFIPYISYYAASAKSVSVNINDNETIYIADEYYKTEDSINRPLKSSINSGIFLAWKHETSREIIDFVNCMLDN